ncbi:MAG: hypothetical protein ABI315_12930 [Bacteroidia bacterium]
MNAWWEILTVFLLSTVKFVFGALPLALSFGFSFFETVFVTSVGGFVGVLFFVYLSDHLLLFFKQRALKKHHHQKTLPKKKSMSRKNRMILNVKNKFGLIGITFLTPLLFSIPLGCFLSVRYFKNKQQIIVYMFSSILLWSVSIASFKLFL